MNVEYELFLPALKNEQVPWDRELTLQDWLALFDMANRHRVLPMIYEVIYDCPAAQKQDPRFFVPFKQQAIRGVMLQTIKTNEFLQILQEMRQAGLQPLVIKGIVCRSLYPHPDHRTSGDEDVLIPPGQFDACHRILKKHGLHPVDPAQDIHSAYEVSYRKADSPIYIELHKSLFPPESAAYGDMNRFFAGAGSRAVTLTIDGSEIPTMCSTDHLFYLICHAFKHFLHSGFGIRQVCDIILFANAHGREVDWQQVLNNCREIHADLFAAALFRIGQRYLTFDPDEACYPEQWRSIRVDEQMLLTDILEAGIYGDGTMSRKHSSGITLNAVSAQKQGKATGGSVLKTAFPPADSLEARYPYLKQYPFLLPVAWASRLVKYRQETNGSADNDAMEAIAIGNHRVELLRQYHIVETRKKGRE